MSADAHLRLDRLELRNFRCFAECSIDLHPQLTVLVAENGHGKTTVLDAVGIALGLFVDTVAGTGQSHGFVRTDVRMVQTPPDTMTPVLPTAFDADGYVAGQGLHWRRALGGYGLHARTTTREAKTLREAAQKLLRSVQETPAAPSGSPLLPVVAFYGTGRLWSEHRLTKGRKTTARDTEARMSGYTDCLSSSSSFKEMVVWYQNKWAEARDPRFSTTLSENLALLRTVQEATDIVLQPTEWAGLDWDFDSKSLVVRHPQYGRLPLSALSDGVRTMIALVADLARRCASLNPHLSNDAARLTPGVLLIDEIDMHLHPRWQQVIVELLRAAFPGLQLILSTHSPHVLSTVDKASIRVIRVRDGQGVIETPALQTRGVESADVLASIMGVNPIPQVEEARWLNLYRAKIETGEAETDEGQALHQKLLEHFGAAHPVILDCARLLRFQAFKRARVPSEGG
jgi:predicted ATP-binding protein involved in virulence